MPKRCPTGPRPRWEGDDALRGQDAHDAKHDQAGRRPYRGGAKYRLAMGEAGGDNHDQDKAGGGQGATQGGRGGLVTGPKERRQTPAAQDDYAYSQGSGLGEPRAEAVFGVNKEEQQCDEAE